MTFYRPFDTIKFSSDNFYFFFLNLFKPEFGLERIYNNGRRVNGYNKFSGAMLKAIDQNDYENADVRRSAKRLMRIAIDSLMGNKPLQSRELFRRSQ